MPRRDVTADWSIELDDSFQGRVVDGSLQFVSAGPPMRTVWLAVWSPPATEPAESNIAWAKSTAASVGVQGSDVREFDEPGSDAGELRYARWYHEAPDGRPRWALNAYTARRGDLVQAAFLSDSAEDLEWALTAWRSLRTRTARSDSAPHADSGGGGTTGTAVGAGIVELGEPTVAVAGFSPPSRPSDQAEPATGQPATAVPSVQDTSAQPRADAGIETATVVPSSDSTESEPSAVGSAAAAQEVQDEPVERQPAERQPAGRESAEVESADGGSAMTEAADGGSAVRGSAEGGAAMTQPVAVVPPGASPPSDSSPTPATTGWSTPSTVVADDARAGAAAAGGDAAPAADDVPGQAGAGPEAAAADDSRAVDDSRAAEDSAPEADDGAAEADVIAAESARSNQYTWLGQLDPAPVPIYGSPMLQGGAAWPTPRQEFRRIRRGPWTVIASSGLSSPYTDPSQTLAFGRHGAAHRVGLGVEVFVEADDPALTGPIETVPANWAMQLAWQASQNVALNGLGMVDWLNEHRIGSIEFYDVAVPESMPQFMARDASGRPVVGALLGLDAPDMPQTIALPGGSVRMLAVTVITARELDYVRQAGAAGRQWLAGALAHSGTAHRSTLVRASLI